MKRPWQEHLGACSAMARDQKIYFGSKREAGGPRSNQITPRNAMNDPNQRWHLLEPGMDFVFA